MKENNCETVAFPLISSGVYGYPKEQALHVAINIIGKFLLENEMTVYIVIFDKAAYKISEKLFSDIAEYIDDNYVDEHGDYDRVLPRINQKPIAYDAVKKEKNRDFCETFACKSISAESELEAKLNDIDESFSQMLFRLIDERGLTDPQVYKRANLERSVFSKLRSNKDYAPSKSTAVALCIALELNMDQTRDLLARAGYALSPSSLSDVIVSYFIENSSYDIYEINAVLFEYKKNPLGAKG